MAVRHMTSTAADGTGVCEAVLSISDFSDMSGPVPYVEVRSPEIE